MLSTHTPTKIQRPPAAAGIDQNTLEAIRAYASNMSASAAAYKSSMQAAFQDHCTETAALIVIQQQYITDRESLHQQQLQDLVDSFQRRYSELEGLLTAEQIESFQRYMKESQGGLDLWQDTDDSDAAQISAVSIEDFMNSPAAEEIPPFEFSETVE
jgi:hypothetical protein